MSQSGLVQRVSRAAVLSACVAALIAAGCTSLLGGWLLREAEDRRLREAAFILAAELSASEGSPEDVRLVVEDETLETEHTGMTFAVFDATGARVAGDGRVPLVPAAECALASADRLRLCAVASSRGLTAVAGSAHSLPPLLFIAPAAIAVFIAGFAAVGMSRASARLALAPLARLRNRLSLLDVEGDASPDLGTDEDVVEVDQLRHTVQSVLGRMNEALAQAHRFAANAAHELRTPLTSVRGELELLAEEARSQPGQAEPLQRMERRVAELTMLVERLLVLATPKAQRSAPDELVSVRDVVEDVVSALEPAARASVTSGFENDLVVRGDPVLLAVLVNNALSNGLKFGREVRVRLDAGVLVFEDDGPGPPEEELEQLFEPFRRGNNATRHSVAGHGLGLALICHVARMHAGTAAFRRGPDGKWRLEIQLPSAA